MYLDRINNPQDLKKLDLNELLKLSDEIRNAIIYKLSESGGHLAPNLGVVELTVALHYVFDSPNDKIIWDVSHQSYAHKIITGRKSAFLNPDCFKDVTGYTNPNESQHDFFKIGHTATSVALALGMAKGRDVNKASHNIIAVIGDGALSGGEAYEGLNAAGEYNKNLIIVVNDNEQSIAENHGGLYKKLAELRKSGSGSSDNIFKALNLDYRYLDDGHDIEKLITLFKEVKDINHPIVLHIHTIKGKGLEYAQTDKEGWHSCSPFRIEDGYPKNGYPKYDTTVFDSIKDLLDNDDKAVIVAAATPRAFGFTKEIREKYAQRGSFIDVGIAEESAVALLSGISKNGGNPVLGVYGGFLQRAYDQLSHDLCLNNNHATILVLLPGAYGMKSDTHFSMCDIQLISHIPNMTYLSPSSKNEYAAMFRYATYKSKGPVAIRVPCRWSKVNYEDNTDYSLVNKFKVMQKGENVAIIAVGSLIPLAMDVASKYKDETDKEITVINPVFLTGVDTELLDELAKNHSLIITLEDGVLEGGFGQNIASYYGIKDISVKNYGITKEFHSDYNPDELLAENGISIDGIIDFIKKSNKTEG